jgi:hypothetical protein
MAESRGSSAHAKFVGALVKDAANPPEVKLLTGYAGASHRPEHRRLYLTPELEQHVDFPSDDVLHEEPMSATESPLGGTRVWLKANSELKPGGTGAVGLRTPGYTHPVCPQTAPPCVQPTPTATIVPYLCHPHTSYHYLCNGPTQPLICHLPTFPCISIFCPSVQPCVAPQTPATTPQWQTPGVTPQFGPGGEFLQGQMFAAGAPAPAAPPHLPICEFRPWPQPATPPVGHTYAVNCTVFGPGCPPPPPPTPVNYPTQLVGCTTFAQGCPPVGHATHLPPLCTSFGPGCPQCQMNLPPLPATRPMQGGYY